MDSDHQVLPASPQAGRPPRLPWLDIGRGLAIAMVVAYHAFGALGLPSTLQGQAGVDAFLMISGFGLAYSLRDNDTWRSFLSRRLWKLLPAYWLILGLCIAYELHRGANVSYTQIFLSATCLHLVAGDPYAFAINMSFWFMGLIVPLYLWFSLIRRSLLGPRAYSVLGISILVAWLAGILLVEHGAAWGSNAIGHAPYRLPMFMIGALLAVAWRRGDSFSRLTQEPWVMAAAVAMLPVSVIGTWSMFPFSLLTGGGILLAAMFLASADRWRLFRPLAFLLTAVGGIAFELYLCHQYLLLTISPALVRPRVESAFPGAAPPVVELTTVLLTLALSVWVAWVVRWIVSPKESARTWRPTLAGVGVVVTALVLVALLLPARLPRHRPRTFQIAFQLPDRLPEIPFNEPIVCFGHTGSGDLIFLEHDGNGRARIGIDHWGSPIHYSEWVGSPELAQAPWSVTIDGGGIGVSAGNVALRSPKPPLVPTARPVVGANPFGFRSAAPRAFSRVERVRRSPATAPVVAGNDMPRAEGQ